jgi:ABC-type phosphate/phosphonate transport system substrate-binding protein
VNSTEQQKESGVMFGQRTNGKVLALALGLTAALAAGVLGTEREAPPKTIQIGLVESLFTDLPKALVAAATQPFRKLMEAQTGFTGEFVHISSADKLAKMLTQDKVHLGVLHGFEFAWVQQKYPKLKPLVIAVNQDRHLYASLLVKQTSKVTNLKDLKGKSLAMPCFTREHCRLFLERECQECGQTTQKFFAKITTPSTVEEALDDVVDGRVEAVLVDGVSLSCYKRRKPVRFGKLKEVEKSIIFPAGVVIYHEGALDEAILTRFREGMIKANDNTRSRQLLTLFQLTAFEDIPQDYQSTLTNIAKAYPPPGEKGKTPGKSKVGSD